MKKTVTKKLVSFLLSASLCVSTVICDIQGMRYIKNVNAAEIANVIEVEIKPTEKIATNVEELPTLEEIEVDNAETVEAEVEPCVEETPPEPTLIDIPIPVTRNKTYEDGRKINCASAPETAVMRECYVDERGHYIKDGAYAVAMGTYFDDPGSKYRVYLDTGIVFDVIKADTKDDKDTTDNMLDRQGAMIEFIINSSVAEDYYGRRENGYILGGNFNNHPDFNGNIVKIEQIKENI